MSAPRFGLTSVVATTDDPSAVTLAKTRRVAHDPVVAEVAAAGELLERDDARAQLEADLEHARLGVGRVTLVGGEAGVGKTSLVQSFTARHEGEVRILWGACEALFTPRPLGPVYDIVQGLEGWSLDPPRRSRRKPPVAYRARRPPERDNDTCSPLSPHARRRRRARTSCGTAASR